MTTGGRIHFLRNDLDLTLQDLGDKVGVSASAVRKWETGLIQAIRPDNGRILIYFNITDKNGALQAEDLNKIEAGQTLSVFDQRLDWWSNPIASRTQESAIIILPYGFVLVAQLGGRL